MNEKPELNWTKVTGALFILAALALLVIMGMCSGCARFHTRQIDTYDTKTTATNQNANAGIQTRSTEVTAWTLFSARSSLTSFAARQADSSQSATVGSLEQQGGTNVAGTIQALANLLNAIPK